MRPNLVVRDSVMFCRFSRFVRMMNHDTHPPPNYKKFFPYPLPFRKCLFSDEYLFFRLVCVFIFSFVRRFRAYCGCLYLLRSVCCL